jgi:two-component system, NarL family, nitrate/nitrite response regulator NarL
MCWLADATPSSQAIFAKEVTGRHMHVVETKPIRVFLVDDHKTVLWGLERLIESAAPRMNVVGMAENSEEMLAKLPSAQPDVILLDLDLGGISSMGCLETLKDWRSIRVLILTGSSDPAVHQQAVVRGARGVVHKQVAAEVLLRAIEKVHSGEIWLEATLLGRVMTALSIGKAPDPEVPKWPELTAKERQIVNTLVQERGARNKIIADKLNISESTLRNHLTTIYSKLGLEGRMELYLYATSKPQIREDD